MENQANIPKLRFPEFCGGWEKKKLEEVSEKIQDGTHFSPKAFDEGDYLYLTSKNVKNGYIELSTAQFISAEAHRSIYKRCDVRKGDVLITKDGTIGQTCVNELEMEFSLLSSVAFIRPFAGFSSYFIYQLLSSDIGQKEIESQIAGQALKRITLTKINNFEFFFPKTNEQQKIASFLTDVDDKLQGLKKKKSLLDQYKKGVMQKIFSQELRFRDDDGSEFPEWEEKKLGANIEFLSGIALKGHEISENNTGTPILRGINITEGSIRHTAQIDRYYIGSDVSRYERYLVEENDLVIGMDGSKVGKNVALIKKDNAKSILIQRVARIRASKKADIHFIYQNIFSKNFHDYVDVVNTSSGIPHISAQQIKDFKIKFPIVKEQTKIANFLSSIDEKINLVNGQIEKMEMWKKGLLQKMFV